VTKSIETKIAQQYQRKTVSKQSAEQQAQQKNVQLLELKNTFDE
jgi:hypothetical protein